MTDEEKLARMRLYGSYDSAISGRALGDMLIGDHEETDSTEPTWDIADLIPIEKAPMLAVGGGKALLAKLAASKELPALASLAAGTVRKTPTGKLLGTLTTGAKDAAREGISRASSDKFAKNDLVWQAVSDDLYGDLNKAASLQYPVRGAHEPTGLPTGSVVQGGRDEMGNIAALREAGHKKTEAAREDMIRRMQVAEDESRRAKILRQRMTDHDIEGVSPGQNLPMSSTDPTAGAMIDDDALAALRIKGGALEEVPNPERDRLSKQAKKMIEELKLDLSHAQQGYQRFGLDKRWDNVMRWVNSGDAKAHVKEVPAARKILDEIQDALLKHKWDRELAESEAGRLRWRARQQGIEGTKPGGGQSTPRKKTLKALEDEE